MFEKSMNGGKQGGKQKTKSICLRKYNQGEIRMQGGIGFVIRKIRKYEKQIRCKDIVFHDPMGGFCQKGGK